MDTVEVIQVIKTTLSRNGKGTETSPVRVVTQYWDMSGKELVSIDPCCVYLTPESCEELRREFSKDHPEQSKAVNAIFNVFESMAHIVNTNIP